MPETTTIESTPNPELQTIIYNLIRDVLKILGTFGVTWGMTVSGAQWQIISGILAALIGVAWGYYQKFQQARLDHAGSVASARGGKAVQVVPASGVIPS